MPNKEAAKKALRQSNKRALQNALVKRTMINAIKRVVKAMESGDTKDIRSLFQSAQQLIDKAAKKGVIKKNTASRRKSRLAAKVQKTA